MGAPAAGLPVRRSSRCTTIPPLNEPQVSQGRPLRVQHHVGVDRVPTRVEILGHDHRPVVDPSVTRHVRIERGVGRHPDGRVRAAESGDGVVEVPPAVEEADVGRPWRRFGLRDDTGHPGGKAVGEDVAGPLPVAQVPRAADRYAGSRLDGPGAERIPGAMLRAMDGSCTGAMSPWSHGCRRSSEAGRGHDTGSNAAATTNRTAALVHRDRAMQRGFHGCLAADHRRSTRPHERRGLTGLPAKSYICPRLENTGSTPDR